MDIARILVGFLGHDGCMAGILGFEGLGEWSGKDGMPLQLRCKPLQLRCMPLA